METGRTELEIKKLTVDKEITVGGVIILIKLGLSDVAFYQEEKLINRFKYYEIIDNKHIGYIARVLVDTGAIEQIKEARNWVKEHYLLDKINDMKEVLDLKIDNIRKSKSMIDNNRVIKLDNYIDNAEIFYEKVPFFYDASCIWWFWNEEECKYEIKDDVDVMIRIDNVLGLEGQTVSSKVKGNYIEAFKRVGRLNIPKTPPTKWIQFKNKAISITSGNVYNVTHHYFFTNPIPWDIGKSDETPILDKLFEEWVGKDYVQDLYEIIAYCCYRDYPIQLMICLYGCGRNGKSQYLKVINKFLGLENICSTELDLLAGSNSSRFEIFKLYKKLACMLGETNFGILSSTSVLKKLVGGDVIGFEKKGKDPFDDYSYAKILIASNSLPSTEDTSDGFMRRWHIIDFPNEFPEGKDIMSTIPDYEYNNLAVKITKILPKLLNKGEFKNQGTISHRKERYMMASNPLPIFIQKNCDIGHDKFILYNKLYTEYVKYLIDNKKRKVSGKEFKSALDNEGYYLDKTSKKIDGEFKNGTFVIGLDIKNYTNIEKNAICDNCDDYAIISTQNPYIEKEVENVAQLSQLSQNTEKNQNSIQISILINKIKPGIKYNKDDFFEKECEKIMSKQIFNEWYEKQLRVGNIYNLSSNQFMRL